MRRPTVVLLTGLIVIAGACGGDDDGAATTRQAEAGDTADTAAGVHAASSDLGDILVDPDGFTLYIFTADEGGESTCYEACADLWPPVPAATAVAADLDDSMFGATTRSDGAEQLTVDGRPVYLYTPDAEPGDTTGQGFNDAWFVLDPGGTAIGTSAGAAPEDEDLGGIYDY
jgi:predicted lipoprotein with Yx(FWY)xxD motif